MKEFIIDNPEIFVIDGYYSNVEIESFFSNNKKVIKDKKIFLCPVNALGIEGNRVFKKENCICCNLCELKYIKTENINSAVPTISDYFLTDIKRLCLVLKYLISNVTVACEVKTQGNYRNKRVDIVYKKDNIIYLMKVLSDFNSYNFYKRSYNEIADYLLEEYPNFTTQLIILVTDEFSHKSTEEHKNLCTFNDFIHGEER